MTMRHASIVAVLALCAAAHGCAAGEWRPLFDGTSLSAWRGYKSDAVPDGWKIEKGTLAKDGHVGE